MKIIDLLQLNEDTLKIPLVPLSRGWQDEVLTGVTCIKLTNGVVFSSITKDKLIIKHYEFKTDCRPAKY
jgi:hypothetical protein